MYKFRPTQSETHHYQIGRCNLGSTAEQRTVRIWQTLLLRGGTGWKI